MRSFFDFLQIFVIEAAVVTTAYVLTYIDYKKVGSQLCEIVTKYNPRNIGVKALYKYSKYTVQWNKYWKKSYDNSWTTRLLVDSVDYVGRFISAIINKTRLEPYSTQWIGACVLSVSKGFTGTPHPSGASCEQSSLTKGAVKPRSSLDVVRADDLRSVCCAISTDDNNGPVDIRYKYIELYLSDFTRELQLNDCLNGFKVWCQLKDDYLEEDDRELLIILKSNGQYLSRVAISLKFYEERTDEYNISYHGEDGEIESDNIFVGTRMNLIISVEYTNPKMENSIVLDVPRGFMNVGNQILSPAFVHRCLEYQNKPYYFDMNYKLKIMDSCTETYEMGSEEMVVFEKMGFRIVKI